MEEFIRKYWKPLYAFARRQGLTSEDAEDATQEFLGKIVSGNLLNSADPAKGKFRSYLLTAWRRFLIDKMRHEQTAKQGGGKTIHSIDRMAGEADWAAVSPRAEDPDHAFMLSWAQGLLEQTKVQILQEYAGSQKFKLAEQLIPFLTRQMDKSQAELLGERLGMSASATKVALHRFRQRYGLILRSIVAETVDHASEIDEEINELLKTLKHSQ